MPARPLWRFAATFAFVLPWLASSIEAQCQFQWQAGAPAAGPDGEVLCLANLPNGDAVAGGRFLVANDRIVNHVARWNGSTWRPLGSGTNGDVYAVAVLPNGHVVAGGQFTQAGGVSVNNLARWDGASWHDFGGGTNGSVRALLTLSNGDVAIGGDFGASGSVPGSRLTRWNGSTFASIGLQPNFGSSVRCLAQAPNGDLYVGGMLGTGLHLGKWNGAAWTNLNFIVGGYGGTGVFALAAAGVNDVFVGGDFTAGGMPTGLNLVRWNGTAMQPVGSGRPDPMLALALDSQSRLVTATSFDCERWDGVAWTPLGDFPGRRNNSAILHRGNDALFVATNLSPPLHPADYGVVEWNGATWTALRAPAPAVVLDQAALPDGSVVVGGSFTSIGGVAANHVARWNGSTWQPLGLGVDAAVTAVTSTSDGSVVVAGHFLNAGGAPANHIARWNGTTWSTLGGGLNMPPSDLAFTNDGTLYSSSTFLPTLEAWDGAAWSTVPGILSGSVTRMAAHPDGRLVCLGGLNLGLGPVRGVNTFLNGAWTPLPTNWTGVPNTLLVRLNGDITIGGTFAINSVVHGVLSLVNGVWTPVGTGSPTAVKSLIELPDGDLLAAHPSQPAGGGTLTRWDGSTWTLAQTANREVTGLCLARTGELFATGTFTAVDGLVAATFARAVPSCPASVLPFGAGCIGSAGTVLLSSPDRPWLGSTLHSEATGMAPLSLALHVVGTTAFVAPLPLGAPGCSLFVDPLFTDVLFPVNGSVDAPLALPNAPGLVGLAVRTQVVGLELDPALALVRTTSSNALLLTLGGL